MAQRSIIFDLDGTLIDSAPSILSSLKAALDEVSVSPIHPLSHNLIGPPLPQIISEILAPQQHSRIPEVIECFKRHYDTHGYLSTAVYPGVKDVLVKLKRENIDLYIATNKRITPTLSILAHLGFTEFFKNVYSLDYFKPPAPNKSAMLSNIRLIANQNDVDLVYVGDRLEDAEAAYENKIPFLLASWGYGNLFQSISIKSILNSPADLLKFTLI